MMIRVLFRKEIRELLSFYMYDRKKKQKRSKAALVGYLCLRSEEHTSELQSRI